MRKEALDLHRAGLFCSSMSSRWNPAKGEQEPYEKEGVVALGLTPDLYPRAPSCIEYLIEATDVLGPLLSQHSRRGKLKEGTQTNKLALATDAGAYPWHLDNLGGDDERLVTLIYYLNPGYHPGLAGRFMRARLQSSPSGDPSPQDTIFIEPRGDRLLAFYSDELLHAVEPVHAPTADGGGEDAHRIALTIWFLGADLPKKQDGG
ncbi:unnamed protein product [Polarella glacialis]|uniref:Fe2OG dioxygenase domain-containing protein n=1 Tax=Polarella glacialis TaxID=89957 RepID=A0A813E5U1_POLGL|nr:unnamed protein product [Polarella glacialis]